MRFLKLFFASCLGTVAGLITLVFLMFVVLSAVVSTIGKQGEVTVDANSVLHINLDYEIPERTSEDPLENFSFPDFSTRVDVGLNDILGMIEHAETDDNIKGIYLEVGMVPSGLATVEAIRDALIEFKTSGKFIVAYGEIISQKGYYLASVADKISLNPKGIMAFTGFSSEQMFFKNTLEKLDIDLQIFYAGKYKSATEPFRLEKMSDANREQVLAYITDVYQHFLQGVSEQRQIPVYVLDSIADNLVVRHPNAAVTTGLVDELAFEDMVRDDIRSRIGLDEDEKINLIKHDKYAQTVKPEGAGRDRIAVLYAEGNIVDGDGSQSNIGSKRFVEALREIRLEDRVKGLVIRVNSPGGSALASEVIWREVELLREKMPVVVSMGNVAASGGYYIACAADSIFAEPNTITGSIGVFGMMPNLQNFFNNKLGITFDGVKTSKFADFPNVSRPLLEEEKIIVQSAIDTIYESFKFRVAQGRGLSMEYVDSIAQGRIYTGVQALEVGLVDRIGGMDEAIAATSQLAGLDEYRVTEYPKTKDFMERMMERLGGGANTYFMKFNLGELYPYVKQLEELKNMTGYQARMPFDLQVK